MWISSLQLENFRNYRQLALDFEPGINLLIGENGAGKTNLVEACVYLSAIESHRVTGYGALIHSEQQSSQLSLKAKHDSREISVAAELNRDKPNRYFLNAHQVKRTSDLVGVSKVVVFAPEDLDLVRRDPQDRRRFLDESMIQLKPRLAGVKADYDRVLKQKAALLKSARQVSNPDLTTLDIWDDQLVSLGSELIYQRQDLISKIFPLLKDFYHQLSGKPESIELILRTSVAGGEEEEDFTSLTSWDKQEISDAFYQRLQQLRGRELERGVSLVGPHRDELSILKSGLLARNHASQGEAWSLALGLKLAMAELLRADSQTGDPVLILDDVFAVLDAGRRQRLVEFVIGNEQVLITSADVEAVPSLKVAKRLEISGGRWLAKLNFEVIDNFFRQYLLGTTGIKSRDQKRREANQKRGSQPFDAGRDPVKASASLEQLFGEFNWTSQLAQAALFTEWEKVVGADSAEASYPEELKNEVLSVRCRSTAWATQLRLLESQILEKIRSQHPDVVVSEIRFIGPTAPSWKKGPRSVPGRGPRDTYG